MPPEPPPPSTNGTVRQGPRAARSPRLLGEIKPEKRHVAVGEDLFVDYLIRSVSAYSAPVDVVDGSKDAGIPFHSYSFNAALRDDKHVPMDLVFVGTPLFGRQEFKPGSSVLFNRIRWRAKQPGIYRLWFVLEWRKGELIHFDEVMITAGGEAPPVKPPTNGDKPDPPVRPINLSGTVTKLIGELASATAQMKRAAVVAKLGRLGPTSAPLLAANLGHPKAHVQMEVTQLLIRLGAEAIPSLVEVTVHADSEVRYRGAYALGEIRGRAKPGEVAAIESHAVPALARLARTDRKPDLRQAAYVLLAQYFSLVSAVPVLLDGLSDPVLTVRRTCNGQLRRLSGKDRKDVSYKASALPASRAGAITRWRQYWKKKLP